MHIEYREDALSYRSHHHSVYEMIYILCGQSRFTVRDQTFLAGPGDIVFFSNLEEHSTNIVQTPYHRYFVMLPPRETDQMVSNARLLSIFKQRSAAFPYVLHVPQEAPALQSRFAQLLLESDPAAPWHHERVRALLMLILTDVCRLHPQVFPGHQTPHQLPIFEMQSYLDAHFTERFSLADLAGRYHVSAGYLSQCFREQVGHSPMQYVMLNRLTAARDMLLTSGLNVSQIAGQCGFNDINNFIRRFSQHYGVTPNKMKRQGGSSPWIGRGRNMLGMTSVTFRPLTTDEILKLCSQSGLDGIEWGGDVHVPAGRTDIAADVAAATAASGLKVLSYGSYYRLCSGMDFAPVLETACALGTKKIRVWAGDRGSGEADAAYQDRAAEELRRVCAMARERRVSIGLEYHRNTLTDTCESALSLLRQADCENLFTYWQPNPDLTLKQRLREIRYLLPHIRSVHVFQWSSGNVRHALDAGEREWCAYLEALGSTTPDYILEFVPDDSPSQFLADAMTLAQWVKMPLL